MATTNAGSRIPPPGLVVPPVSLLVLAVALVVHPTGPGLVIVAAFLGAAVVVALLVLRPETIAAARAALLDRAQTSLNLALGLGDGQHRPHHPHHRGCLDLARQSAGAGTRADPDRAVDAHRGGRGAHRGAGSGNAATGRRAPGVLAAFVFVSMAP